MLASIYHTYGSYGVYKCTSCDRRWPMRDTWLNDVEDMIQHGQWLPFGNQTWLPPWASNIAEKSTVIHFSLARVLFSRIQWFIMVNLITFPQQRHIWIRQRGSFFLRSTLRHEAFFNDAPRGQACIVSSDVSNYRLYIYIHIYIYTHTHMEVSWNGGTPVIIHSNWIFRYKPSILGTSIYGTPHIIIQQNDICAIRWYAYDSPIIPGISSANPTGWGLYLRTWSLNPCFIPK